MTPDHLQLLRRLALNDREAIKDVMRGETAAAELNGRTKALVTLAVLLGVGSSSETLRSVIEEGIAAGVEDGEIVDTMIAVAPVIGLAQLSASLPQLMAALDIETIED